MTAQLQLIEVSYDIAGKRIVENLSYSFPPGRLIAMVGPNGAGKSTTLRLAAGLIGPSAGRVLLDGREVTKTPRRQVAQKLAWVPQDTHLDFAFSAGEIVLMGRSPHLGRFGWPTKVDRDIAHQAMAWTRSEDLADRIVTSLSGGERQRILLARALATDSPIILLDEPISNLDIQHQLDLLELTRKLVTERGKTIIMVVHDLNYAMRFADEAILMDQGRVLAYGTPRQVLAPDLIRATFQVEALSHNQGGFVFSLPSLANNQAPSFP